MCTVLLPPGDNPIAVNKYIIFKRFSSIDQELLVPCIKEGIYWSEYVPKIISDWFQKYKITPTSAS